MNIIVNNEVTFLVAEDIGGQVRGMWSLRNVGNEGGRDVTYCFIPKDAEHKRIECADWGGAMYHLNKASGRAYVPKD